MLEQLRSAQKRAVGTKQVLRALEQGQVVTAFVAKDADPFLTKRVMDASYAKNIQCLEAETMKALGEACGIDVPASAAAVLRN